MKKVRVTISDFMNEIIKSDSEYFKMPVGRIGNIIFKYYMNKNLNKVELGNFSGEVLQFNLNKNNDEINHNSVKHAVVTINPYSHLMSRVNLAENQIHN